MRKKTDSDTRSATMAAAFQIEAGIPAPKHTRGFACKYPFRQMRAGESFFVPGITPGSPARVTMAAYKFARANRGFKFRTQTQTEQGGVRVWCVKSPTSKKEVSS